MARCLTLPDATFWHDDARAVLARLPEKSVHAAVTSPPYYGLRSYHDVLPGVWGGDSNCLHQFLEIHHTSNRIRNGDPTGLHGGRRGLATGTSKDFVTLAMSSGASCVKCGAWLGCLGNEPDPASYVSHLLEVCMAVHRVLRDDGTFVLNIGDSYAGSGRGPQGKTGFGDHERRQGFVGPGGGSRQTQYDCWGLKSKDLMLIPSRVAIALVEKGWYLRNDVAWCKTSAMPSSVQDRMTNAWEHIFLLTKSDRYFWDWLAVAEPAISTAPSGDGFRRAEGISNHVRGSDVHWQPTALRNLRDFWLLGPEPLTGVEHFAAFPSRIPKIGILGGTSEKGVCIYCGAPWTRIVSREDPAETSEIDGAHPSPVARRKGVEYEKWLAEHPVRTLGWKPSCKCRVGEGGVAPQPIPAVVLDPFGGTGTTSIAARILRRHSIYIDASASYVKMAENRLLSQGDALPMEWADESEPAPVEVVDGD